MLSQQHAQAQVQAPSAPIKKRVYKCGHCKQSGHNRATCPMKNVETERGSRHACRQLKNEFMKISANTKHNDDAAFKHKEEEEQCSICFESCNDKQQACCQLECKHKFHTDCIFKWMSKHNSCPLCRKEANKHSNVSTATNISNNTGIRMPDTHVMWMLMNRRQMDRLFPNVDVDALEWCEIYQYLRHELNNMSEATFQAYQSTAISQLYSMQ